MLQIDYSFCEKSARMDELSGFDLGHMELRGDLGTATSRSRIPDQAMMLILSLASLLYGLRSFLSSSQKEYEFIGDDCSFRVVFSKKKKGEIDVYVDERNIESTDEAQLKADVEASVSQFIKWLNNSTLPSSDAALRDLHAAFKDFQEFSVD